MKTQYKISTILAVFLFFGIMNPITAQKFYDSSIQYSITNTENGKAVSKCKETYKLYVTKQGFQPYLNNASNKIEKGISFQLYEKNNDVFIKFEDDYKQIQNIKLFSKTIGSETTIDSEIEYPMLCFFFGSKVIFEGKEKCVIEDVVIESYKIIISSDENNYSIIYINSSDLIPLKYEIIETNRKSQDMKSRIVVEIESIKGKFNSLTAFAD